jgi:nucleotide-binding universal stress UspA family protein
MKIRTLLVPTDFSEHADRAVEYAGELARELGAKVEILHAYQAPLVELTPYHLALPVSVLEGVRDIAREKLEALCEKLAADGVEANGRLSEGIPAEAIVNAAADLKADMIVMGTRGNTGLKHVLLGSVAERTVRRATCPVLTLHADEA